MPGEAKKMPTERPIRVLCQLRAMLHGGIETWLMHIFRHADRRAVRFDIAVETREPCSYDEEARQLGVRLLPCMHSRQPWRYARQLGQILHQYGPYDVVHGHSYLYSGLILRTAAKCGVSKRIAHIHPDVDQRPDTFARKVYRRIMTRWLSQYATDVVSPSLSSLNAFKTICDCRRARTGIIPNIVDLDKFERPVNRDAVRREFALPLDKPLVIYVARFSPHKNHEQFLRVAASINQGGRRVHFLIVGTDGPLLPEIRRRVSGRDDVSLLTGLDDVSRVMRAADLFFFPSLNEGFGVVAVEAAAAGLPVVATNLSTIHEACHPSMHRFMFEPNDDAKASESILAILADNDLYQRLSRDGKLFASQFSATESLRKLMLLYTGVQDATPEDSCATSGLRAA